MNKLLLHRFYSQELGVSSEGSTRGSYILIIEEAFVENIFPNINYDQEDAEIDLYIINSKMVVKSKISKPPSKSEKRLPLQRDLIGWIGSNSLIRPGDIGIFYNRNNRINLKIFSPEKNNKDYRELSSFFTSIPDSLLNNLIIEEQKINHLLHDITEQNISSPFESNTCCDKIIESGLVLSKVIINSFLSSLLTKPFVILTGLSGSGKTKLAQAFAEWICKDESQICLIPVGADWTSREPLLGYPNALEPGRYVKPDNGVVDLLIEASKTENNDKPYFLILDEMNLSHVERYFADFLSIMEAGKDSKISLHPDTPDWKNNENWKDGVPDKISLPSNLFVIGTVNIDETTYMFSPKVLDRANVIEFRVAEDELDKFLSNPVKPDLDKIRGAGAGMAADFLRIAREEIIEFEYKDIIKTELLKFFRELKKTGAEFGYRTSVEIFRFIVILKKLLEAEKIFKILGDTDYDKEKDWLLDDIVDAAILQKLLPKLHGSKKKLERVLPTLGRLCLTKDSENPDKILGNLEINPELIDGSDNVRFKRSLEKILRMKRRADQDGFTSFAEA